MHNVHSRTIRSHGEDEMTRRLKRKLMIGIAVVAVLAGVTAAVVMAAQPAKHHHGNGQLATAAGYLGASPTQVRSELRSGKSLAQIADATAGRSEAGLIAALEAAGREKLSAAAAKLPSLITAEVDRAGGPTGARASGRPQGGHGRALTAAASYLGVGAAQLRGELRSGKTLTQIADATSGKSEAGLVQALLAARKTALASRVSAGKITQAQANAILPKLVARVSAQVNRVHGKRAASARRQRSPLSAGAP
jgi:hypothetical protein